MTFTKCNQCSEGYNACDYNYKCMNPQSVGMKTFHVDLMISTTGNHNEESVKQWLTDLLGDAMASDIERNGIIHLKVYESVCPDLS